MTPAEFDDLVQQAYEAAFSYLSEMTAIYEAAYERETEFAVERFEAQTVITAAWTPPPLPSLTDGMSQDEQDESDRVRREAAAAIVAILAAAGVAASSDEFMQALNERAQMNFEQEIMRNLRTIVAQALEQHLTAEDAAAMIREQLPQVIPASADMLAQTQLTALVNERSVAAAQTQFQGGAVKTWRTVGDNRVRAAHAASEGQTVPVDQPFQVGGSALMYPGDPAGPLRLTARCRCRLSFSENVAVVASAKEDTLMAVEPSSYLDASNAGTAGTVGNGTWVWVPQLPPNSIVASTVTVTVTDDAESPSEDAGEPSEEMGTCPNCGGMMKNGVCMDCGYAKPMADGPAWRGLLAVEGVPSEDGRMLAEGSLTWRDLPLSLTAMDTSMHGAEGEAKVAGRIDRIWRDGNEIWGEGVFNTDEFGTHIYELVSNQSLRGNSIEPAVLAYEVRNRDTGEVLEGDAIFDAIMDDVPLLTVFTDAVIMCSTIVATPALADANIVLASGVMVTSWYQEQGTQDTLTASAAGMAPLEPPAAWFEKPVLMSPTALTISDDGQVLGHVALWNSCHIGEPSGPGVCVPPPRSGMNYEIFHHGVVRTAEGHDIPVGQLTLGTLHAGRDLGWKETIEHYEHSGLVFADVHAYEDQHGIVVAGALRPDVPATKVREARAGALSGDWRQVIGRGLEFLAALVVNVPGFPIPRPEARIVASAAPGGSEVMALVAAGMVPPADTVDGLSRREYLRKIRSLTET